MQEQITNLIDLAGSHITQHTNGHLKSDWSVELNETNEKIQTFPKHFTDNEIFSIMDFAKKYELVAFNRGISFGKSKVAKVYTKKLQELEKRVEFMKTENERLANALEQVYLSFNEGD